MAVLEYRKHILVSRPHLDQQLGLWIPYASVAWQGVDGYRFHRFTNLVQTFKTEEDAEVFGFGAARTWVDEQLGNRLLS
jgi:hypothetical protein